MSETPAEHLQEEPQSERGPMGSRDTGSDEPAGGPTDRPAGVSEPEDDTSAQPQDPEHPDAPYLRPGG